MLLMTSQRADLRAYMKKAGVGSILEFTGFFFFLETRVVALCR